MEYNSGKTGRADVCSTQGGFVIFLCIFSLDASLRERRVRNVNMITLVSLSSALCGAGVTKEMSSVCHNTTHKLSANWCILTLL